MTSYPIDAAQVDHIADLARLSLSEKDRVRYRHELSHIVEYFGQLSSVSTSGVAPLTHPLPMRNVWALDEVRDSIGTESALCNAPQSSGGFFAVPRVLEDSGA